MNIAQSIRSLLDKEGRVVVPGLGIFETRYYPASLNKDKNKISPPQTRTSFIQKLDAKDDQLASYLAQTENIPKEKSQEAIEAYVKSLTEKLKLSHKAKIERIGYLTIRDKHLHFRPDVVNDLPELQAEPVRKEATFASYLAMPLILLFIMVLILIYLLVNPFNTPLLQGRYSGHYALAQYPTREIVIAEAKPVTREEMKTPEPSQTQQQAQEQAQKQAQEQAQPIPPPPPRTSHYHIIVASLEYRTMAEVYAEKLVRSGYPEATVIGPAANGNYRVSLDNFKEKQQALLHLMFARKLVDANAWILKY